MKNPYSYPGTIEGDHHFPAKASVVRIDPRFSVVAIAVIAGTALFVLSTVEAMAAVLFYLLVWYFAAGGRVPAAYAHGKRLVLFSLFIIVLNCLLVPGETLLAIGQRTVVSSEGLAAGVFLSVRLVVLYFCMVVLLQAAPPEDFANGVFSLCRPLSVKTASRLAFYGFIALSFLPLFAREYERVRAAQSFRGAGLTGSVTRRIISVRLLLVPLILSAVHRSGQLAAVVELRGLKNRIGETVLPARPSFSDYLFAAVTVGVLTLAVTVLGRGPST